MKTQIESQKFRRLVLLLVFLGGYLGDEIRFWIARHWGPSLFAQRPKWRARVDRAITAIERYGTAYIFLYRYPKGMRTVGALPVGLSDMSWTKFTALNAASTLLWSIVLTGFGYLLGDRIAVAAENWWGIFSIALLVVFLAGSWIAFRRVSMTIPAEPAPARPEHNS